MKPPLSPVQSLLRAYVALSGTITACTIGFLDRYTPEHRRFLSSGFQCGSCQEYLIGKWLVADVNIYDAEGNKVPMMVARFKGKRMACPKCGHQWEFRRATS